MKLHQLQGVSISQRDEVYRNERQAKGVQKKHAADRDRTRL